jgi:hypothetical protein
MLVPLSLRTRRMWQSAFDLLSLIFSSVTAREPSDRGSLPLTFDKTYRMPALTTSGSNTEPDLQES